MPENFETGPERLLASTRAGREIQPHQAFNVAAGMLPPSAPPLESVDAATAGLYKGGNGGGRNPAAAVL
jgi:hypothetical protein